VKNHTSQCKNESDGKKHIVIGRRNTIERRQSQERTTGGTMYVLQSATAVEGKKKNDQLSSFFGSGPLLFFIGYLKPYRLVFLMFYFVHYIYKLKKRSTF